ncbi:hypothetical protein JOE59_002483 [Agromyces cerinus]|uniref:hypothetical protein n=1 Tax=Agromyces cerinus TaxID=33878 RepID=UPI001959A92C|nr:hypothetical protein [Agromyces cerinus]MBM7831778.1 hypothetical protein [Agromyces cerinus]
MWAVGGVAVAAGIGSALLTAVGSLAWGVVLAVLFGLLALTTTAFGLFAVRRSPPVLINAVTLGRATVRPVDDWVHFCRERPVRIWSVLWLILTGLGSGVLLGLAMPGVLSAPGGLWWLFLFVPLLALCLVALGAGVLQLVLDGKNTSFGRIPVGLTLSRHGVARYLVAGGVRWVPWDTISGVETQLHSRVSISRIGRSEPLEFTAGVFEQDAVLLYCAVRFYVDHPELREELSTIVAQRRFESWDRALSLR